MIGEKTANLLDNVDGSSSSSVVFRSAAVSFRSKRNSTYNSSKMLLFLVDKYFSHDLLDRERADNYHPIENAL